MKTSKKKAIVGLTACFLAFGAIQKIDTVDHSAQVGYYVAKKSGGGAGWQVVDSSVGGFVGAYVGAKIGASIGAAGGPVGAFLGLAVGAW